MARNLQAAALASHDAPPLPAATALAALGIVYGDIGTSPLYAFKQAVAASGTLSSETVIGVVSLILWTLILIVSLKYAIRAENVVKTIRLSQTGYQVSQFRHVVGHNSVPLSHRDGAGRGSARPGSRVSPSAQCSGLSPRTVTTHL
jgi:hypothetical protein